MEQSEKEIERKGRNKKREIENEREPKGWRLGRRKGNEMGSRAKERNGNAEREKGWC